MKSEYGQHEHPSRANEQLKKFGYDPFYENMNVTIWVISTKNLDLELKYIYQNKWNNHVIWNNNRPQILDNIMISA